MPTRQRLSLLHVLPPVICPSRSSLRSRSLPWATVKELLFQPAVGEVATMWQLCLCKRCMCESSCG